MLYLLHFDKPFRRAQHYLGACKDGRLDERMREHATGKGSTLTRHVVNARITIYLARVFPEMSFEEEKRVKRASHFKNWCPLCCPMLARLACDAYAINTQQLERQPQRAIWDNRPPLDIR